MEFSSLRIGCVHELVAKVFKLKSVWRIYFTQINTCHPKTTAFFGQKKTCVLAYALCGIEGVFCLSVVAGVYILAYLSRQRRFGTV